MIGVALTVALFAFFWALRGKLNTWGLKYVQWNRTSALSIARAMVLGLLAGCAISWLFRNYEMGVQPPFAELWIAVTWGPLVEEVVFLGYLFSFLERFLKRWLRNPGWLVVTTIAAAFAAGHLIKTGITPVQIATVFFRYALWLAASRAVPLVCAHISYNSVIYLAAALLRPAPVEPRHEF